VIAQEHGFTAGDFAHTAKLLRSTEEVRKASSSNNHNIILAALDRCSTPAAPITDRRAFLNRVRSLHNIDHDQLPELDREDWHSFRDDPVHYFMRTDDYQQGAIWREVEKRQAGKPDVADQEKVNCPECKGTGRWVHEGPYRSASGPCSKCHGDGTVRP
jgi:hypothetical protein